MMDYEIQKSTRRIEEGKTIDKYDVCIGGEWTEGGLTLDELAELRDFLTQYINREKRAYHEQAQHQ